MEPTRFNLDKFYSIPYVSYTQLSTYMTCPHSYYLTYIMKQFERTGNKYTELGKVLHDIFEAQGRQLLINHEKPLMIDDAIQRYNVKFFKIDKKHFDDKEDMIKLYQKGITAIEGYYSVYTEEPPLFVEKKFQCKIAEGLPPFKSFVDRIDGDPEDASTWVITDYKTGASPKTKSYLKGDLQLGLYASQVFASTGKYPKVVQFYHPVPDKFQKAIHQGDGVYRFTNQREPVVEFSVADTIEKAREVLYQIVTDKEFHKEIDPWSCKSCFHYQSGACKPWDKEGWGGI